MEVYKVYPDILKQICGREGREGKGKREGKGRENVCFYKYAHNLGPWGSPDTILTAFDVKFHEKKGEIPLGVHRPPYT